jgi:hypothetical protein
VLFFLLIAAGICFVWGLEERKKGIWGLEERKKGICYEGVS